VRDDGGQREHAREHGVPIEDPDRVLCREVREQGEREPPGLVERHAAEEVPQRGAEEDG